MINGDCQHGNTIEKDGMLSCADCGEKGLADLVYRLKKRASIRRSIASRKSVAEGRPDRIADLLDEAAVEIERLRTPVHTSHECIECGMYCGFKGE